MPERFYSIFMKKTGDGRYKVAMDTLRKQLAEQPRTSEGGFWHKTGISAPDVAGWYIHGFSLSGSIW